MSKKLLISSNRWQEWLIAVVVAVGVAWFMMEYHRLWRGKGYSWMVLNECLAISGTVCVSLALLFGRFTSTTLLRLRRALGIVGVATLAIHATFCLGILEKFTVDYYFKEWLSFLLGVASILGLLTQWVFSYDFMQKKYGRPTCERVQSCGYFFLILGVTHFVILGKIPSWINWFKTMDKPMPPGTIVVFLIALVAVLAKGISLLRKQPEPAQSQ